MFFGKETAEEYQLNPEKMPRHIAIIMDGNGRWATKRALPRKAGHKAGAEALEKIIYAAKDMGLEHLTVYAFSTENWKRSEEEVGAIMDLLRMYLKNYFKKFLNDPDITSAMHIDHIFIQPQRYFLCFMITKCH